MIQSEIEILKDQRAILNIALKQCSWVAKVYESEANFILFQVDDASKRYRDFVDAGIVVRIEVRNMDVKICSVLQSVPPMKTSVLSNY